MVNLRYVGSDPSVPDSIARKKDIDVPDANATTKGKVQLPGPTGGVLEPDNPLYPYYPYGLLGGSAAEPHIMYVSYLVKVFTEWNLQIFNNPTDSEWEVKREGVEASFEATLAKADNSVQKTGNETVAGIKTFSSSPIAPMPTASNQVAIKLYADGKYADSQTYTDTKVATRVANASGQSLTLWTGTQAAYVALGTWDASTLYVIV